MNTQYCKIGKSRFQLNRLPNLKELEHKYLSFVEEAYNVRQLDASISDYLYFEASKLKQHILRFKEVIAKNLDAA